MKRRQAFAAMLAGMASSVARADKGNGREGDGRDDDDRGDDQIFVFGIVRNTALPAPFNQLVLSIEATALRGGTGFGIGSAHVDPMMNCYFNIGSAAENSDQFVLSGTVSRAFDSNSAPTLAGAADGLMVTIVAEEHSDLAALTVTLTRPPNRQPFLPGVPSLTFHGFGFLEDD